MQRSCPVTGLLGGFFLLAFILVGSSLAQITFERTYDYSDFDAGHCVRQTGDGGYIIAGWITVPGHVDDWNWLLIKTDSLGNAVWHRTYGVHLAQAAYVEQTPDTGYIIAGSMNDITAIKTDPLGNVQWARSYGFGGAHSLWQTLDGGFIITASIWPGYIYLIKTNQLGFTTWTNTCGIPFRAVGISIQQTLDGGYILGGYRRQDDGRDWDIYLVKTNPLGDTLWTRTFGGEADDRGFSVEQTPDQAYVIAGYTKSFSVGATDAFLAKVDSSGHDLWRRTYGGVDIEMARSVQQTSEGGYILAGHSSSGVYLVRTDSLGYEIWSRTYGTSGAYGSSVQQTSDGGYIITGRKYGDVYLIKTDENGFVGIQEENGKPKIENRKLLQNVPNPFRASTVISYSLPAATHVTLEVFDISGRLVETLIDERQDPGIHQARWDVKNAPSGVYFYRLKAGEFTDTKKMVIID